MSKVRSVFFVCAMMIFFCFKVSTMEQRYCKGIYNDMVQTLSETIFSGTNVDKGEIERSVDFLDNRSSSPVIDSKYKRLETVNSDLKESQILKDECLSHFANDCLAYFKSSNDLPKQIAVSFLLHGVIEKCKTSFKLRKSKESNESITFWNSHEFGVTFDKPLIPMFDVGAVENW